MNMEEKKSNDEKKRSCTQAWGRPTKPWKYIVFLFSFLRGERHIVHCLKKKKGKASNHHYSG